MKARSLTKIAFPIIYGLILSAIFYVVIRHRIEILIIFKTHLFIILLSIILSAFYFSIQAYNFLQLLGKPALFRKIAEVVRMWTMASLINYLGPFQPGLIVRFGYLKSQEVSLARSAKVTIRQIQLSYLTGLFLASTSMIIGYSSPIIKKIGIILLIVSVCIPFFQRGVRKTIERLVKNKRFESFFYNSIYDYLTTPPIGKIYLFFIQHTIMALVIFLVYRDFNMDFTIFDSYITGILTTLSTLVSIAPNNMGIQELIFGKIGMIKGQNFVEAIGIALMFRIAHIGGASLAFLGSSIFLKLKPINDHTTE